MRCLMCGKEIGTGRSLSELLFEEDVLCHACRAEWQRRDAHFRLHGVPGMYTWIYNEACAAAFIQFKECGDEALKEVFLKPCAGKVRRYLKGRTLLLMPSTQENIARRGFSHLKEIFESLDLPMEEPFEKTVNAEQKTLGREERKHMSHAIKLKENAVIPAKCALVDDVITTGATLSGALKCLEGKQTDLVIYACARVPKKQKSHGIA